LHSQKLTAKGVDSVCHVFNIYVLHMPGIWSVLVAWPAREPIYDLPRRDIEILASAKMLTGYQNYGMHKCCINIIINIHSTNIKKYHQIWYALICWKPSKILELHGPGAPAGHKMEPCWTWRSSFNLQYRRTYESAVSPLRLTTFYQHTQGEWYV
jgi:hypothetical protein